MKAGHAWRKSSFSQPGKALKVDGVIKGAGGGGTDGTTGSGGCGTGTSTGGGIVTGGRAGTGCGAGGVVHAVSASATTVSEQGKLRRVKDIRTDMWILMMEAGVAFFLLVFIVWWTMYADKKPDHQERALRAPEENKDTPELPRD